MSLSWSLSLSPFMSKSLVAILQPASCPASYLEARCFQVPDYEVIGQAVAALQLPTVITQEGGYKMDQIASVVETFLKGFVA